MDRSARPNVAAATGLQAVTKPVEKAMEFLPAEQRDVHVGDRAEHRKFKVTGEVVSVDGTKAVLNVNGRKMQVDTRDLAPLARQAAGGERRGGGEAKRWGGGDAVGISAGVHLLGH